MILATATLDALLRTCAPAVSADTMRAIVSVESHGYSYAINDNTARAAYCVPGGQVYPCKRDEAIMLANSAIRLGHSVDVGIAQVNSGNFHSYRVTAALMLEPCANLRTGSAILADAYRDSSARFGNRRKTLWHAIMAYNTGSLYAGENYVRSVVDAAFPGSDTPIVPSIMILRTLPPRPPWVDRKAAASRKPSAVLQTEKPLRDPSSATLIAQGLDSPIGRGDRTDTLQPALSRPH